MLGVREQWFHRYLCCNMKTQTPNPYGVLFTVSPRSACGASRGGNVHCVLLRERVGGHCYHFVSREVSGLARAFGRVELWV